jgi:hypothetical protein
MLIPLFQRPGPPVGFLPTALEPRSNPDDDAAAENKRLAVSHVRGAPQPAQQRGFDRCLLRPNLKCTSCPSRRSQIPPLISKLASPLRSAPPPPPPRCSSHDDPHRAARQQRGQGILLLAPPPRSGSVWRCFGACTAADSWGLGID